MSVDFTLPDALFAEMAHDPKEEREQGPGAAFFADFKKTLRGVHEGVIVLAAMARTCPSGRFLGPEAQEKILLMTHTQPRDTAEGGRWGRPSKKISQVEYGLILERIINADLNGLEDFVLEHIVLAAQGRPLNHGSDQLITHTIRSVAQRLNKMLFNRIS